MWWEKVKLEFKLVLTSYGVILPISFILSKAVSSATKNLNECLGEQIRETGSKLKLKKN